MIREPTFREETVRVVTYHQPNLVGPRLLAGAFAGLVAAGPMALALLALKRILPSRSISEQALERMSAEEQSADEPQVNASTWLAHFGYGALAGAAYPFTIGRLRAPTLLKGWAHAMMYWACSYLGWLPVSNIFPAAADQPRRRNAVMIVGHLLWGTIVAMLADWIDEAL